MRSFRLMPVLLLIACGDNHEGDKRPDARPMADAMVDAPMQVTCNYTESADATNDNFYANGNPEATSLSFGTAAIGICGKLEHTHYVQNNMVVDVDSYLINVPAQTSALLSITAPGAEALNTVLIEIYGMSTSTDEVGKFEPTQGFAIASARLPPGDYVVNVSSFNTAAATATIDYKLVLRPDSPTRCAKSTATANYTESLDGTTADGNDVYEVRYMGSPRRQFTAAADMVEPTGITVAPDGSYRVSGTNSLPASAPASWADFYQDRDTYQLTMGANANQLSLRLSWPGTTADLDFLVFPMGGLNDFATGYYNAKMEDEFATFAVIPGMSYWVFVGADDSSSGQPISYDLTACGATYTP